MIANNLDFDEIVVGDDFERAKVRWLKSGEVVHELTLRPWDAIDACLACLKLRGIVVKTTDRKTLRTPEGPSTYAQCPECKGLAVGQDCNCGEAPHRVSCPMGFGLYFRYRI